MKLNLLACSLSLLALAACASDEHSSTTTVERMENGVPVRRIGRGADEDKLPMGAPMRAIAQIKATMDSPVTGTVTFTQQPGGVEVRVHLENLPPGRHGFHVHEMGDCGEHGDAAGAHFNPDNAPHGDRVSPVRHVGDLGNVTADASGTVDLVFTDTLIALSGKNSIVNRAMMVHADPDDGTTQPTGNAGKRIACGVILAQP